MMETLLCSNHWLHLPESFYQRCPPTPLSKPTLLHVNQALFNLLGLQSEQLNTKQLLECFNGDKLLAGMQPLATVYAGHQFGIFTSKLGDGRAILLGQTDAVNGQQYELQVKGAGLTAYSRTLDGRYPLNAAIREYLAGEALTALGIASTRSLALIGSETIIAEDKQQSAAILVRVAKSHIRFGHFEYFYHRDEFEQLRTLFDFVIEQQFPELLNESKDKRPLLFLQTVIKRTAELIAKWQSVGFTHGVMNTDNMTVSGETLDLGPFGFIESYDPDFSPNPSDDLKRYQFDQQADIGRWNCLALAQSLTPLLNSTTIPAGLLRLYRQSYQQHYLRCMLQKLGLYQPQPEDQQLIDSLLVALKQSTINYSLFFRQLTTLDDSTIAKSPELKNWLSRYQQRLTLEKHSDQKRQQQMHQINPFYVLHEARIAQVVEAVRQGDLTELDRVMKCLQNPFEQ